jgi:pimeloyl-ACP methyl ester carboxylesterase
LREHRINTNGLSHFVRDCGRETAPAVLLLHGFPDSSSVWAPIMPILADGGFRVIAPDMRGFGQTDMPARVADYDIQTGAAPDMIGLLDALSIPHAHIVGHDFGAPVAWSLAAQFPDRFLTLAAISVGHTRAFLNSGAEQKRRSAYILLHLVPFICEWVYRRDDWALLRKQWSAHGDIDETLTYLSRPKRLTAGLNWYRSNIGWRRIIMPPPPGALGEEIVRIPTLGIFPADDKYLTEAQMTGSQDFVDAPWEYARIDGSSHWPQYDAPAALAALLLGHWRRHSAT